MPMCVSRVFSPQSSVRGRAYWIAAQVKVDGNYLRSIVGCMPMAGQEAMVPAWRRKMGTVEVACKGSFDLGLL